MSLIEVMRSRTLYSLRYFQELQDTAADVIGVNKYHQVRDYDFRPKRRQLEVALLWLM